MPQRRDNAGAVCNSGDRLQRRPLVPKKSVDEQIFNSSQSTSLTFIICLFELGHPNDLRPTATPTACAKINKNEKRTDAQIF